jgi:hypothetical protein
VKGEKERKSRKKNRKRKTRKKRERGRQLGEKKNAENRGSFFPSSLGCCEIKKASSRGEGGEERAGKTRKERETINKQGLPFGLCFHFSAYNICRTGKKKVQEPGRERDEDAEERKKSENRRKYRTGGKGLKQTKRTDQPSHFQRRCSFFTSVPRSVLFTSRTMHFFALCLHCSSEF